MSRIEEFWSRVDRRSDDECWPYLGWLNDDGYGVFQFGGWDYAHRFSWITTHGPIEDGQNILHSCDNPACCNPGHLFIGSHADNVADKVRKGRQAKGRDNGRSKLSEDQVVAIFIDTRSNPKIARDYGIDPAAVRHIKTQRNWSHLTQKLVTPVGVEPTSKA